MLQSILNVDPSVEISRDCALSETPEQARLKPHSYTSISPQHYQFIDPESDFSAKETKEQSMQTLEWKPIIPKEPKKILIERGIGTDIFMIDEEVQIERNRFQTPATTQTPILSYFNIGTQAEPFSLSKDIQTDDSRYSSIFDKNSNLSSIREAQEYECVSTISFEACKKTEDTVSLSPQEYFDPKEAFFHYTIYSIKTNFPDIDKFCKIEESKMLDEVRKEIVPVHLWPKWLNSKLTKMYMGKLSQVRRKRCPRRRTLEAEIKRECGGASFFAPYNLKFDYFYEP